MSKTTADEPATLRDVAEAAGVSIASASRALAGRGDSVEGRLGRAWSPPRNAWGMSARGAVGVVPRRWTRG